MLNTNTEENQQCFDVKIQQLDQISRQQEIIREEQDEELAKKNHNFIQFNRDGLKALYRIKNPTSIQIFLFMAEHMRHDNQLIVSHDTLAYIFESSRPTISLALKMLEEKKMIKKMRINNGFSYSLNANVVWSTYATNKKLATFQATIILSPEEHKKSQEVKSKIRKQLTLDLKKPTAD